MIKRTFVYLTLIALCTTAAAGLNFYSGTIMFGYPVYPTQLPAKSKVLLIPLDSRPPCIQYVEQLAALAQIQLILPPNELLDNYNQPAQQGALREWLAGAISQADAAIISTDMLIHGGLLASRNSRGTSQDIAQTLSLLQRIRQENPNVKLYGFSIIPRLLLSDSLTNGAYQKLMAKYSVLKDQVSLFENPLDIEMLNDLEKKIPARILENYLTLYQQNTQINLQLLTLAEQNVFESLVLGQDDGLPFGLPNMEKRRLVNYVEQRANLADKVIITRGTDEVALTLLGRLTNAMNHYRPRIYVKYSEPAVPDMVMPYMPHTIRRTVQEKIALVNGVEAASEKDADFTLYVHAGSRKTTAGTLTAAAQSIKKLITQGYKVAVVDLSENYYASETLLPYLIEANTDLTKLAAYAGWNTTSNSIGTAVTQGALFVGELERTDETNRLNLYITQLTFLSERFVDDWYYQKDVQFIVNTNLRSLQADPYKLGKYRAKTTELIDRLLKDRAQHFFRQNMAYRPIVFYSSSGKQDYRLTELYIQTQLPWDRTFEIKLTPELSIVQVISKE